MSGSLFRCILLHSELILLKATIHLLTRVGVENSVKLVVFKILASDVLPIRGLSLSGASNKSSEYMGAKLQFVRINQLG